MSLLPTPHDPPACVRLLPNTTAVVTTRVGAVLVHCPPETLKYLLALGLTPPQIILLPPDVPAGQELGSSGFVRQGINYASVEFLIYSNFFVAGRQVRLITITEDQAQRIRAILEETTTGPRNLAAYGESVWVRTECSAVSFYPPLGRSPNIDDMVVITSLEAGGGDLGATQISLEAESFVFREDGLELARLSTQISKVAVPLALAPPQPVQRQELTLQFIGGSDGFDPAGITTCFLAYLGTTVQSQATLFDAAAYLLLRLGNLGVTPSHISEVVISHLHEDHIAGLPELILMGGHRVRLVTSEVIYQSLLRVLGAMLALPITEVAALFDYYRLDPGTPLELEGRRFEAIYAIHSIPTIAVRVGGVCYSGDMRYDEEWFGELEERGILQAPRRQELLRFAEGANILVQDVGGGAIHTTITPRLLHALTAKSQRLVLAHTSKHLLPVGSPELGDRITFAGSGVVLGIGAMLPHNALSEIIETIAACPLFARLTVEARIALANAVTSVHWPDNAVILQEGQASDGSTYIVHSGLVEIWIAGAPVRILGRGSSIGERGAIMGEVRSSTMVARGNVELLKLAPETFGPIAERLGLATAFAQAEWLSTIPVLRELPWASLLDLALDLQPRHLATGEQLFAYGEPGYEGFVLVSGAINFNDADGSLIETLQTPGEFFGGRAAIYGRSRSATASASAPSVVWALPAPALERLNLLYPNLLMHLRAIEAGHRRRRKG
ncbi:cyclic nucleotide-binding domain-containing protein [Candidatus Viridilinea mediisalina]|uniref:Cyclic nucleotide-binding protein n=1 Tax=Candidatus Viridilinea mediisalina TaxID=2024553 RepID=A0A2A6RJP2_9CHLR|nr:cyclic nucleotide-binding domain-containing protein [Candidatus Viridilinea mediisalina]PDW03232.1 cyclic nucleotide-binding protein [Candidatus Viridilinea mediisalina]